MDRNQICSLLQEAVINFCQQNATVWSCDIEVDGIICISPSNSSEQHVVKIHEKLGKPEKLREHYSSDGSQHRNDDFPLIEETFHSNVVAGENPSSVYTEWPENDFSHIEPRRLNYKKKPKITEIVERDRVIISMESEMRDEKVNGQSSVGQKTDSIEFSNKDANGSKDCQNLLDTGRKSRNRKSTAPLRITSLPHDVEDYDVRFHVPEYVSREQSYSYQNKTSLIPNTSDAFNEKFVDNSPQDDFIVIKAESDSLSKSDDSFDISLNTNSHDSVGMTTQMRPIQTNYTLLPPKIPVQNSSSNYTCKYCGKGFTLNCTKVRHERTICGGSVYTMHKCDICQKSFTRSDSRVRHMLKTHGITSAELQYNRKITESQKSNNK